MNQLKTKNYQLKTPLISQGFSLVEVVIGSALLAIVTLALYQSFASVMNLNQVGGDKLTAIAIANEQIELLHNLPYQSVGVVGGIPAGVVTGATTTVRNGLTFTVTTTVRNIDDPFDGLFPSDTSPADYKLAEVVISCAMCKKFTPITLTTTIAPKTLESTTNNGALQIMVYDASAKPVQNALVTIKNTTVSPTVDFNDVTDAAGKLLLVDIPPANLSYEISATKAGYSTDGTSAVTTANPTPALRHATVAAGKVTNLSVYIDKLSSFEMLSSDSSCTSVPAYDAVLQGSKTIGMKGSTPVYKYNAAIQTNGSGVLTVPNLEWDAYLILPTDTQYDLAGTLPVASVNLAPGAVQNLKLIVKNKNPSALLVTVKDEATKQPVAGASVNLIAGGGYNKTYITGRGVLGQSDWVGGAGQESYTDPTKFYDSDGNVKISTTGELSLKKTFDTYASSAWLTSSTIDLGTVASLYGISWTPQDQPGGVTGGVGSDPVRFQIASNNDSATWNFTGPDGTANSYYNLGASSIGTEQADHRYFRYKLLMQTASTTLTPTVDDIQFQYTTACTPGGQVLFQGVSNNISANYYTVSVTAPGYQSTVTSDILVNSSWQERVIYIAPQ